MIDGKLYLCIKRSIIVYSAEALSMIQLRKVLSVFSQSQTLMAKTLNFERMIVLHQQELDFFSSDHNKTFTISDKLVKILSYVHLCEFFREGILFWRNFHCNKVGSYSQ